MIMIIISYSKFYFGKRMLFRTLHRASLRQDRLTSISEAARDIKLDLEKESVHANFETINQVVENEKVTTLQHEQPL